MNSTICTAIRHAAAFRQVLMCSIAAILFMSSAPLRAADIFIDDTSPAEAVTFAVNDFEGGFSVNGTLIQQGLANPGVITLPETGPMDFVGRWLVPGGVNPHSRLIYLVEAPTFDPLVTPLPPLSDILRYTVDNDTSSGLAIISGTFISADDLGRLPVPFDPANVFPEDGLVVPFFEPFLTGGLLSDRAEVPEPGTLALLASGLSMLGCVWWRRRRLQPELSRIAEI